MHGSKQGHGHQHVVIFILNGLSGTIVAITIQLEHKAVFAATSG